MIRMAVVFVSLLLSGCAAKYAVPQNADVLIEFKMSDELKEATSNQFYDIFKDENCSVENGGGLAANLATLISVEEASTKVVSGKKIFVRARNVYFSGNSYGCLNVSSFTPQLHEVYTVIQEGLYPYCSLSILTSAGAVPPDLKILEISEACDFKR